VRFRIGALHRVAEPAMAQAFELVAGGTVAEGAEVDLVILPVRVACRGCGAETADADLITVCPRCGATGLDIVGGDELILESIQLAAPV
jgi:hydrogenase nickel incorporation protein HypA/HybF